MSYNAEERTNVAILEESQGTEDVVPEHKSGYGQREKLSVYLYFKAYWNLIFPKLSDCVSANSFS